jgi:hypothetical protein
MLFESLSLSLSISISISFFEKKFLVSSFGVSLIISFFIVLKSGKFSSKVEFLIFSYKDFISFSLYLNLTKFLFINLFILFYFIFITL